MRRLWALVIVARRAFRGSLALRFAVVIGMAILTGVTAGVLPAVIGRAMGAVAGGERQAGGPPPGAFARLIASVVPGDQPWLLVAITLVATVLTVGIGVTASRMGSALSGDVTAALRTEMMRAVLYASARDVDGVGQAIHTPRRPPGMGPPQSEAPPLQGPGDGATRTAVVKLAVSREAALVGDFAVSVFTGLPQSVATLAVLAVELSSSGAWLVLVGGIGLFVLSRLVSDRASRRVGRARRDLQNADAAVFGFLQETLSAAEDLRLWGARGQVVREFAEVAHDCAAERARFAAALAISGQIKSMFTALSPLLLVVALELSQRPYGPGDVAKLLLLVPLLMVRLEALDGIRQGLIERAAILEAAGELVALAPAPPPSPSPVRPPLEELAGEIRFEGVRYTPPGARAPVLDGVDLAIPAGAVVAICGPSGSGKSTLLRLLLRLDDPDEGRITLDGIDLRDIEPELLPRIFGVVRQTSGLLERTVRDNLALGLAPAPDVEAMFAALSAVQLEALAEPGGERGLHTPYRRHPPNFSGGEHRRLLVARMILQDAPVGVLDEPEAGLPAATAAELLAAVRDRAGGRTQVVVTHAPHLLDSDLNVVLDGGRVAATGSHDELRATCRPYQALLAEEDPG